MATGLLRAARASARARRSRTPTSATSVPQPHSAPAMRALDEGQGGESVGHASDAAGSPPVSVHSNEAGWRDQVAQNAVALAALREETAILRDAMQEQTAALRAAMQEQFVATQALLRAAIDPASPALRATASVAAPSPAPASTPPSTPVASAASLAPVAVLRQSSTDAGPGGAGGGAGARPPRPPGTSDPLSTASQVDAFTKAHDVSARVAIQTAHEVVTSSTGETFTHSSPPPPLMALLGRAELSRVVHLKASVKSYFPTLSTAVEEGDFGAASFSAYRPDWSKGAILSSVAAGLFDKIDFLAWAGPWPLTAALRHFGLVLDRWCSIHAHETTQHFFVGETGYWAAYFAEVALVIDGAGKAQRRVLDHLMRGFTLAINCPRQNGQPTPPPVVPRAALLLQKLADADGVDALVYGNGSNATSKRTSRSSSSRATTSSSRGGRADARLKDYSHDYSLVPRESTTNKFFCLKHQRVGHTCDGSNDDFYHGPLFMPRDAAPGSTVVGRRERPAFL